MRARLALCALAILGALAGCQTGRGRRTLVETIGGAPRVRSFASSTAYEAFLRAEIAVNRGSYEEAARQIELATFADDTDGWLCARRAELLLLAGDRVEGLSSAEACARRFGEQAACWVVLGEALVTAGRASEATAAFTRALAVAPGDPEVRESVALGQGATRAAAAVARETAPETRPGDRTQARRALLDAGRDARPTLAALRRARARSAQDRGAHREVDALLTPLYTSRRATIEDRLALIDARVADGRPRDAAPLVAALSMIASSANVSRVELARLWLLVGQPERAIEASEQAAAEGRADALSKRLHGTALVRAGRTSEGFALLAAIDASEGEFVEAQIEAARALEQQARSDLADRVLTAAIARLGSDPSRAIDRDRSRIALARALTRRGASAQSTTAALETAWGRQQRGMLSAESGAISQEILRDLRERSGDRREDGRADAWLVLVCQRPSGPSRACGDAEIDRALVDAERNAAEDPVTLRARASRTRDAAVATALRRQAQIMDPLGRE